jgi:diguanylate cyclase (GGDEF)-like protein
LLLLTCVGVFIYVDHNAAVNGAERELRDLSRALAEGSDRGFQSAETIEAGIIDRLREAGATSAADLERVAPARAIHDLMKDKIANATNVDALSIIGATGKVLNFSRSWPAPAINVADRDYFKALAANPGQDVVISMAVRNRGNGGWVFYLAKPLRDATGGLAGLVIAAMNVAYFEASYSSFAMVDGRVSLYRDNGTLLARYPHVESEYAKAYASLPIFTGERPDKEGAIIIRSLSDGAGTRRLLGYTRLQHYPAVMTISKSMAAILADWRGLAIALSIAAAVMVLLIATTVFVLLHSIDRAAAEAARARLVAETEVAAQQLIARHARRFELAMNNILHGLSMFDADERLTVCNKRYIEMYRLPADLALPGTLRSDIMRHQREALGSRDRDCPRDVAGYEADVPVGMDTPLLLREFGDGRTFLVRTHVVASGGVVVTHEDVTERRKAEERLTHMARHDTLTDLVNRAVFEDELERALARTRQGGECAVLCLDLDHFKDINDTLGHFVGDGLLREVAARLNATVRADDTVARIGSDEFAIVQAAITGPEEAADLASAVVAVLARPYDVLGHVINIGASVGIVRAPRDDDSAVRLLRKADIALYRAKADGRRGYRFFEAEMDETVQERRRLELDLRQALGRQEFELYYQPLVDIRTRRPRAFEALARWNHPERGLISPLDFIPLAEDTGLIVPIGEWILNAACREAMAWPADVSVSVNVSVSQFKTSDLVETVSHALAVTGLPPARLELEITESVLLRESDDNLRTLHALRALGVHIVLDDFGTGYSSLNYLRFFPFDKIKIDKSFVHALEQESATAIVRAISDLGRALGMTTTAEGVETCGQWQAIADLGCTEIQGYLVSRPVPAGRVAGLFGVGMGWAA